MDKSVKEITYFSKEGRMNMHETFKLAKERAVELGIDKIFIFSANGKGALEAVEICKECEIQIYAVTFPYRQKFYTNKDKEEKVQVGIVDENTRKMLKEKNVEIINGVMPFQDIIIPDAKDVKLATILNTLSLFGGGLHLCVEAIIMAFEKGFMEENEEVIACSADTAIVATGSFKRLMFSPFEGMEIKEIICKPRNLTITKEGKYKTESELE